MTIETSRLGELLVENGVIKPRMLEYALAVQRERQFRQRLGEILVEIGAATTKEILDALAQQVAASHFSFRLGDLLVARSLATRDQIEHALAGQAERGGLLGEILVGRGVITTAQLMETLEHLDECRLSPLAPHSTANRTRAH